jgi:hypothetical protein
MEYEIANGVCPLNIELVVIIEGQKPIIICAYEIPVVGIRP